MAAKSLSRDVVVEGGGRLVEGGPELVEGAVHAVDREVAGEEAPVDAERLEAGSSHGPNAVGAHRPGGRHSPDSLQWTLGPSPQGR